MPSAEAAPKKKHVRFVRMEEGIDRDEQEENTLFDKRKDNKKGLKSALKGGKGVLLNPGSDQVNVVLPGRSQCNTGACWRWLVSLALCASFLGLGMAISVLGPTFEDLAVNVNKNISNLSYIFVGRSSGYIGGSLLGGILFDCMNPHLLLASPGGDATLRKMPGRHTKDADESEYQQALLDNAKEEEEQENESEADHWNDADF